MRRSRFVGLFLVALVALTGCSSNQKDQATSNQKDQATSALKDQVEDKDYTNVVVVQSDDDRVSIVTAQVGECKVKIKKKNVGRSSHTNKYIVEYVGKEEAVPLKEESEALINKSDASVLLRNKKLCDPTPKKKK